MTTDHTLPGSGSLPVDKLASLFRSTTTSYKHLFFHSLLSLLKKRGGNGKGNISFGELEMEMLTSAFHTVRYYRLNLGKSDRVAGLINTKLEGLPNAAASTSVEEIERALRNNQEAIRKANLLRYVPYKVLSPWIRGKISLGSGDNHQRELHRITSSDLFHSEKFLYRTPQPGIGHDEKEIVLHPEWQRYLFDNIGIIEGWADHCWLNYLQSRNPNSPSLANKLWKPGRERSALTRQRNFWDGILKERRFTCIYSHRRITVPYALDHFLPYSWIGHDQMWNLVPTFASVNSSKGQQLPQPAYVQKLFETQNRALNIVRNLHPDSWKRKVEDYTVGLNLGPDDLLIPAKLRQAYQSTVKTQLQLARNSGFGAWKRAKTPQAAT